MSYARFGAGGSDVYVFMSDRGLECCGCLRAPSCAEDVNHRESAFVAPGEYGPVGAYGGDMFGEIVCATCGSAPPLWSVCSSTEEMFEHLRMHKAEGDVVPDETFIDLANDDYINFPLQ